MLKLVVKNRPQKSLKQPSYCYFPKKVWFRDLKKKISKSQPDFEIETWPDRCWDEFLDAGNDRVKPGVSIYLTLMFKNYIVLFWISRAPIFIPLKNPKMYQIIESYINFFIRPTSISVKKYQKFQTIIILSKSRIINGGKLTNNNK